MENETWTIGQLEDHLFSVEEVRVVFRAPRDTQVEKWPFKNTIGDDRSVLELRDRIDKTYPTLKFNIVDGRGAIDHMRGKKLLMVRESYQ